MDIFLPKIDKRKQKILLLLESEERQFTIEQIVEELNVSRKTASLQMKMLQEELKSMTDQIWIEGRGNSYILHRINNYPIYGIVTQWITNSITFRFVHDLFFGEIKGIENFKEKNHVSTTVFYKETRQIRNWLTKYEVSVEAKPNLKLYGEEHQIRYLFFQLYWDADKGREALADKRDEINTFIIKLEKITGYLFNSIQREQLALAIRVSLIRIEKELYVEVKGMVKLDRNFHGEIIEAYQELLTKYILNKQIIDSEIDFFFMLVSVIPLKLPPNNYFTGFKKSIQPSCTEAANELLAVIGNYIVIDAEKMKKDVGLKRRLEEIHCEALFFTPYSKHTSFNMEIKSRTLNKKFDCIINEFKEKYKKNPLLKNIYNEKKFLLKEYAEVFDHYICWYHYIKKVNIQIHIDGSFYEERRIRNELIKKFQDKIEISNQNDVQHPDIVITNIILEMENYPEKPEFFFVDNNPKKEIWDKLSKLINQF